MGLIKGLLSHQVYLHSSAAAVHLTKLPLVQASLVAQRLKRLPTMRETWVQYLGQEDHLEKEMATQSIQYSYLENPMDGGAW